MSNIYINVYQHIIHNRCADNNEINSKPSDLCIIEVIFHLSKEFTIPAAVNQAEERLKIFTTKFFLCVKYSVINGSIFNQQQSSTQYYTTYLTMYAIRKLVFLMLRNATPLCTMLHTSAGQMKFLIFEPICVLLHGQTVRANNEIRHYSLIYNLFSTKLQYHEIKVS